MAGEGVCVLHVPKFYLRIQQDEATEGEDKKLPHWKHLALHTALASSEGLVFLPCYPMCHPTLRHTVTTHPVSCDSQLSTGL